MLKPKLLVLLLGAALLAMFTLPPASAQDGPTITVEPGSVDAAGSHDLTITGSGWTAAPPVFVLPCPGANGSIDEFAAQGADACDTGALTPATPDDGSFEVTVTYDIPAEGLVIAAGDAGQTESAVAIVTVGGGGDAPTEEATVEAAPEMPATGAESAPLAIAGMAVLAAGAMVVGFSRKLS